ncbi:MAG: malonate transporter [Paracoccaceae bacterium]|jgi:malonate transporter
MLLLLDVILPVFLVICSGYIAVKSGFMSEPAIDGLMKFSQNFAIPLLLFRAISTLDMSQSFDLGLLTSYYTGSVISFLLGLYGARFLFGRAWDDSVSIGFTALFANSVLLGLAIMERAFGTASLAPNYAIVAIHAPFCYFLGITTMEIVRGSSNGITKTAISVGRAMFSNYLMLAIGFGFAVNFSGLLVPSAFADGMDLIARAALPTALFALGGILVRYRPEGSMREVLMVCVISLFIHPAIAFFMSTQIFDLPIGMVRGAVLTAAMAPGMNAFIFASMYDSAKRVSASAVLAGTLFSIVSVTFWLAILS